MARYNVGIAHDTRQNEIAMLVLIGGLALRNWQDFVVDRSSQHEGVVFVTLLTMNERLAEGVGKLSGVLDVEEV